MGDEKIITAIGKGRPAPAGAEPPVAWPVRDPRISRQGAISRKLYTYTNYKSWAEKMRANWVEEVQTTEVSED